MNYGYMGHFLWYFLYCKNYFQEFSKKKMAMQAKTSENLNKYSNLKCL